MTQFLTPPNACKLQCPIARTFGEDKGSKCMADRCTLWRWKEPMMDQFVSSAIKREAVFLAKEDGNAGKATLYHKKATENVMNDPEAHGLDLKPKRGYCGLGGRPEL